MKKCGTSILCVVLLLSLCACGRNNSASKEVMRYVDNKYKSQEFSYILSGETAQGFEALLTASFYYDNEITMYSAAENDTYIVVFDVTSEEFDLSQYMQTLAMMSAYGYQKCGVDNQLFFTYSPKNIILYAVHNGEDITTNYN